MEPVKNITDASLLDHLVYGRVEPHIYAFETGQVPLSLKIGDTYRPLSRRLDEWRRKYADLNLVYTCSARIDNDTVFRDHAVHRFLENVAGKHRLEPAEFTSPDLVSVEFFADTDADDVKAAVADIHANAKSGNVRKYQFYNADRLPKTISYRRGPCLELRANQAQVVRNFKAAIAAGRRNLLMFAVMRFGKSFTSMCCAVEADAKCVLVVSAKAGVSDEWKRTVEATGNFEGYVFADKNTLLSDSSFIRNALLKGERVVLFLTLQDLSGEDMKKAHEEVFATEWDMLLVDETHFGARAAQYGRILQTKLDLPDVRKEVERQMRDVETMDDLDKAIKQLKVKTTIHLSGTPYRILAGNEFSPEDIIAFVQFQDIADAQKQWDDQHALDENVAEWENPYFGFPQMIRFAFRPNESSLQIIRQFSAQGAKMSFSEIFRPRSLVARDGLHREFVHRNAVMDFMKSIDGTSEDNNILAFLDNDRIKSGRLCRHIVMVLPYCASCDSMEALLADGRANGEFRHWGDYEVVNISGVNALSQYRDIAAIKEHIAGCERAGKRTLTLTVNRMLTGSTVPQWDTMLFLKECASPQEYDQAVFRLQNPYVEEYSVPESGGSGVRLNLKSQTILVDFNVNRILRLQELKSSIYNANVDRQGNRLLGQRLESELSVSPIIVVDNGKLREVTANDVMDAVRDYSSTRSVMDEASGLPVDLSLMSDPVVSDVISNVVPLGVKGGLSINAVMDDGTGGDDIDPHVIDGDGGTGRDDGELGENQTENNAHGEYDEECDSAILAKKIAAYYARLLFFAFLSPKDVKSLEEIITVISGNAAAKRISKNVGLDFKVLQKIQSRCNPFVLSRLDYAIQNISSLMHEASMTPLERAGMALSKFRRISESEIVTPSSIASDMVNMIPLEFDPVNDRILDMASKQGEFAVALTHRYGAAVADSIYSVCTSGVAYEFTRKIYEILGLPVGHVLSDFTTYDLIASDSKAHLELLESMNFQLVISNPPYQENDNGAGASARPVYHNFVDVAKRISGRYVNLIMPARWFSGGKGLKAFREMMLADTHIRCLVDYQNSSEVFSDVAVKGGVCYFLRDEQFSGQCRVCNIKDGKTVSEATRYLREGNMDVVIRYNEAVGILRKVSGFAEKSFSHYVSARKPFGFASNFSDFGQEPGKGTVAIHANKCKGFVARAKVLQNDGWIDKYKVMISESYGAGEQFPHQILNRPFIGGPGTCCTETYLVIGPYNSIDEAEAVKKYISTRFFRFLVLLKKNTQHATSTVYSLVPVQDFTSASDVPWNATVDEIDMWLCDKYGLSPEERDFVWSMIKPMKAD